MIADEDLVEWVKADESETLLLRSLERAAVATVEHRTGRYWGPVTDISEVRVWRGWLELSTEPIDEVLTLEGRDNGAWSTLSSGDYYLSGRFVRPIGRWSPGWDAPIRATYSGGYPLIAGNPDEWDAPEDIKDAVRLLVAHRYLNREAVVVGAGAAEIPQGVEALIRDHKRMVA